MKCLLFINYNCQIINYLMKEKIFRLLMVYATEGLFKKRKIVLVHILYFSRYCVLFIQRSLSSKWLKAQFRWLNRQESGVTGNVINQIDCPTDVYICEK